MASGWGVRALGNFLIWIGRSSLRIGVTVVGLVVLAGGLVMMVTPGPGLLGIIGGLAILGTQYAWARRWLERVKAKARQAASSVRRRSSGRRRGDDKTAS